MNDADPVSCDLGGVDGIGYRDGGGGEIETVSAWGQLNCSAVGYVVIATYRTHHTKLASCWKKGVN